MVKACAASSHVYPLTLRPFLHAFKWVGDDANETVSKKQRAEFAQIQMFYCFPLSWFDFTEAFVYATHLCYSCYTESLWRRYVTAFLWLFYPTLFFRLHSFPRQPSSSFLRPFCPSACLKLSHTLFALYPPLSTLLLKGCKELILCVVVVFVGFFPGSVAPSGGQRADVCMFTDKIGFVISMCT